MLEPSGARLELARALVDLGAAQRRAGRRAAAREPLRRGVDLAVRCGPPARAHRPRGDAGLRRAPAAARAERRRVAHAERAPVAELAARDRSNRQIAQALFVTEKTVEGHLARAYDKLGVRSRTRLPDALGAAA